MIKVFIIVLNFRGSNDTKECIHSILSSSYKNYEIIVVDNFSGDGSVPAIKEAFPDITILETESNLGYAGGNNVGIKHALEKDADAVLVLNNDTVLAKNCLKEFVKASSQFPNSALGGRVYYYDEPEVLQHFGGMWNKKKGKFINVPNQKFDPNLPQNLDFVTGCALFIPRKILEEVGLFEESFFLYYEEIDWCFQVRKKGFFCTYVPTPVLWHKESRSFVSPKPPQSYFQWRNRILFIKRNLSKKEHLIWLLTKLPRRFLLLLIKWLVKKIDALFLGDSPKKQVSRLSYKASIRGVIDYFRGAFGKGPSWIYLKK